MSRYHSYINSAREILKKYKGGEPFASFLKKYFSADKKYGSKDRKQIGHLCYCYFRIGKMKMELPVEERIMMGLFLCSAESNEILQQLKPEWNEKVSLPIKEKISLLSAKDFEKNIFQLSDELSDGIEKETFILSHLKQPEVFLRLRPGKEESVKSKLKDAGINFEAISNSCLALPSSSKVDTVIELNKEAVVQDYSSQRVREFLQSSISNPRLNDLAGQVKSQLSVWDCCAGSGGKSILAKDILGEIDLTVSDLRESILLNLKKRFKEAGIENFWSFVADLTKENFQSAIFNNQYSIIIADVPCSGSGTWGRTPEQLFYFDREKINEYVVLQKKILSNAIPHLQPGGYLLYITCSVFKKENEEVVDFIKENFHLNLIKMEIVKGYDKKADTMFAAILSLPK